MKNERDNLQSSSHATSIKFQEAIDNMNAQIVQLTSDNGCLRNEIQELNANGRMSTISNDRAGFIQDKIWLATIKNYSFMAFFRKFTIFR